MKFGELEKTVREILIENEAARGDDFVLVYEVFKKIDPHAFRYGEGAFVAKYHAELGFPSYESITRSRRKLQKRFPELKPSEEILQERSDQEERVKEFVRE